MKNSKSDRGRSTHVRTPRVAQYIAHSLATSTRNGYAADLKHFRSWGGQIPATPSDIARYLAAHAGHLKVATLERKLAAVASAHAAAGFSSPTRTALVRRTLQGVRRVHGEAQKQALPLTPEVLRLITRPASGLDPVRDLRDRAMVLLGFAGGFRRSELVALRPCDLSFSNEGLIVTVISSKTDPYGRGRKVAIGGSSGRLSPVKTLKAWLSLLQQAGGHNAETSPLFRRIDRYGYLGGGLCSASVGLVLRQRLELAGVAPQGYSAHSLRAGLVTAAARAGAPIWAIQRQTGHRAESSVHAYIRSLTPFEMNAFRTAVKG